MDARALIRRWHSPVLFGLIGLASCSPSRPSPATEPRRPSPGSARDLERPGGRSDRRRRHQRSGRGQGLRLALATLAAAALGLALGIAGLRVAAGAPPSGPPTTILMARKAFTLFGPDVTFHEGYTLTLLLFLWAGVLHGARAWRRRRRARVPRPRHEPAPAEALELHRKSDPYGSPARTAEVGTAEIWGDHRHRLALVGDNPRVHPSAHRAHARGRLPPAALGRRAPATAGAPGAAAGAAQRRPRGSIAPPASPHRLRGQRRGRGRVPAG